MSKVNREIEVDAFSLRFHRLRSGLTQKSLAAGAELKTNQIQGLEQGSQRFVTTKSHAAILEVLRATSDDIAPGGLERTLLDSPLSFDPETTLAAAKKTQLLFEREVMRIRIAVIDGLIGKSE